MKVTIDENKCVGCGTCEGMCPDCFKIENGVAKVISDGCDNCDVKDVAESCPVDAIVVEE